ncbi:hypothetical protein [Nostoc sp. TCL240-02]|uniref:hypothetical protein n=1 Tax=Nostoc sp. TCL240-02 TaxID=2572090 RepID=UPI00157F8FEE|nr:hypothetical protein [Nostoc sp. TCL240-02]
MVDQRLGFYTKAMERLSDRLQCLYWQFSPNRMETQPILTIFNNLVINSHTLYIERFAASNCAVLGNANTLGIKGARAIAVYRDTKAVIAFANPANQ